METGRQREDDNDDHNNDNNNGKRWNPDDAARKLTTPNNKRKKRPRESQSCSSSVSTAATSTVVLTPMSVISTGANSQTDEMQSRRLYLQQLLFYQAILVTFIFVALLLIFVPWSLLLGSSALAASTGALSYTAYRRLQLEYQEVLAGDGFARFLPNSIHQLLTETSFHAFMSDNTFVRE